MNEITESPDPFDSKKTLVFRSMSTVASKHYLNSSAGAQKNISVYLGTSIDYTKNPGCHWKPKKQDDGSYRLQSQSTSGENTYLDSSAGAAKSESVYLANQSAGKGSYWIPTRLPDDCYSLKSKNRSDTKHFLDSNASASKENSVYLVENTESIGTHWKVGVDYYIDTEVEDIIHEVYPQAVVSIYEEESYGTLDYDLLHGIWKDSKVGDYKWSHHKFGFDDFAVCLKAAVSKYSYKLPTDKGCLCGIMWGRNKLGNIHAFNFTIDPFRNLILFDPEFGQQIGHDEYVPYFCML